MRARWLILFGAGLLLAGCGDNGPAVNGDGGPDANLVDDGGGATDGSGATDSGGGGDAFVCLLVGAPCTGAGDCCSLSCDLDLHVCSVGTCGLAGASCAVPTDCCSLDCVGGFCDATVCTTTGVGCTDPSECCTNNCQNLVCAEIVPGGCTTLGNACGGDAECCSLNCQAGRCSPAFTCAPIGDICYHGSDCCTGVCTIPSGLTAGTCGSIDVTGAGGCDVAGLPCLDGGQCCSRLCVPTSMGGNVCQITSGCRLQGELCTSTGDCCPGPDQSQQYGLMECNIMEGTDPPIGRCRNPTGCNPVGNVCGDGVSAPHDCCDCQPPKINCCHPDSSGVPRCHGGSTTPCPNGYDGTPECCIAPGGQCSFSSECCEGRPCVPDDQGVLRCGATQCVPQGGVCTSTSDCCNGLICDIAPGALTGTCEPLVPPPDGGVVVPDGGVIIPDGGVVIPDGGVVIPDGGAVQTDAGAVQTDAGVCALPGQHCVQSADCCFGYTCYAPGGVRECTGSDTGCTCYTID